MSSVQIDIDGHDQPERICACGCKRSLEGMRRNAIYATSACRARDWKRREGYADPRRRKASRNGRRQRPKPSGLQVSFPKAVEQLEEYLTQHGHLTPYTTARAILKGALSERQRAKLAGREPIAPTLTTDEQRARFEEQRLREAA
jgi:hypothetical protein